MNNVVKSVLAGLVVAGTVTAGSAAADTLRVGSDITSPPYIYFDDSKQPAGFDAEFMRALGKAGGFDVTFQDTRFESLILGLKSDKFDVIASSMFIKPERAQQVDFIPYGNAGLGFAVSAASKFRPETAADLCGKRVAIIKGAAYIEIIQKVCTDAGKSVDIREFPTSAEATHAVLSTNVDAQADDAAVLKVAADRIGGRLVVSTKEVLYPVVLGIGVSKDKPEVKAKLDAAFDAIQKDGTYSELLKKYNITQPTEAQFHAAIGKN